MAQPIREAIEQPRNAKLVKRAKDYVDTYAGDAKPELNAAINRAARFNRVADLKGEGLLKTLQGSGNRQEIQAIELAMGIEPKIAELLQDADVAEAFIKELRPERIDLGGVIFGVFRIMQNPTKFRVIVEKLSKAGLGKARIQQISNIARFAARATVILNQQGQGEEAQEDGDDQELPR